MHIQILQLIKIYVPLKLCRIHLTAVLEYSIFRDYMYILVLALSTSAYRISKGEIFSSSGYNITLRNAIFDYFVGGNFHR